MVLRREQNHYNTKAETEEGRRSSSNSSRAATILSDLTDSAWYNGYSSSGPSHYYPRSSSYNHTAVRSLERDRTELAREALSQSSATPPEAPVDFVRIRSSSAAAGTTRIPLRGTRSMPLQKDEFLVEEDGNSRDATASTASPSSSDQDYDDMNCYGDDEYGEEDTNSRTTRDDTTEAAANVSKQRVVEHYPQPPKLFSATIIKPHPFSAVGVGIRPCWQDPACRLANLKPKVVSSPKDSQQKGWFFKHNETRDKLQGEEEEGAPLEIYHIAPGGLLDGTPIEVGDRLLSIDGKVFTDQDLAAQHLRKASGILTIAVERPPPPTYQQRRHHYNKRLEQADDGAVVECMVTKPSATYRLGISLRRSSRDGKLRVSKIMPSSLFADAPIQVGYQVVRINGVDTTSALSQHQALEQHPQDDDEIAAQLLRSADDSDLKVTIVAIQSNAYLDRATGSRNRSNKVRSNKNKPSKNALVVHSPFASYGRGADADRLASSTNQPSCNTMNVFLSVLEGLSLSGCKKH